MKNDLAKSELYEGVKTLVESENQKIHLSQAKLFTLFSVAFQYFLFQSTKNPGAYIIRVEDGVLAEKLAKKSKDPSTRKFIHSLLIPRKLKYERSVFYLDYFNPTSWNLTNELSRDKIKGVVIIKNTSKKTMIEIDLEDEHATAMHELGSELYYKNFLDSHTKTIIIAFEEKFEDFQEINFPFIKKEKERTVSGVTINEDLEFEE